MLPPETTECQGPNCPSFLPSASNLVALSSLLLLLPAFILSSLFVAVWPLSIIINTSYTDTCILCSVSSCASQNWEIDLGVGEVCYVGKLLQPVLKFPVFFEGNHILWYIDQCFYTFKKMLFCVVVS